VKSKVFWEKAGKSPIKTGRESKKRSQKKRTKQTEKQAIHGWATRGEFATNDDAKVP